MGKPPTPLTSVEDSCQCGAAVTIVGPDARYVTDQHDEWLDAHKPCQEWHDHWWERLTKWLRGLVQKGGDERG